MSAPDSPVLLPDERRERVLQELRRRGTVRVNDLADAMGVTAITVRRDISLLADQGLLRRVHGGAKALDEAAPGAVADGSAFHARSAELTTDGAEEESAQLTLGMVVPSLDYYWPDVIRGVRAAAADLGSRVVLRGASYDAADERHQLARLVDSVGVDGLLVAPTTSGAEGEELVRWLQSTAIPVVLVEREATVGPYHEAMESVVSDHTLGARMAVRHLVERGHQRVGIAATVTSPTTPHVRRGWREACAELRLPHDDNTPDLHTVDHRDPAWPAMVDQAIDACLRTGTTAILVHSDPEAISLVERCQERGIDVPGDLAVLAYDDQVAALCDPPLTAVRPHREAIGRAAVDLLTARLRDTTGERPPHRVVVGPRLVVRGSTTTTTTTPGSTTTPTAPGSTTTATPSR